MSNGFRLGDSGDIQSVNYGPNDKDVERVLICSNANMIVFLGETILFFDLIGYTNRLQEVDRNFRALRNIQTGNP